MSAYQLTDINTPIYWNTINCTGKTPAVQTCMFGLKNVKLWQSSGLADSFTPGLILFYLTRTHLINVHSGTDSVSDLLFVSLLIYVLSCDQVPTVIRPDKVVWERLYIPWTPGILLFSSESISVSLNKFMISYSPLQQVLCRQRKVW